jgi:pimeloyl-ACP methyl ester carboxylesterase
MTSLDTEINGINIHYRVYGQGEPLLLIMGLGGNADWWDERLLESLAERYQVVTFDNRGAGRSGKPEGPYAVPVMASDTVGLMDHLGWESANVLGISMGGMIAQEIACTYPDRVRRLVLVCTNCGGREQVLASPEVYAALNMPREGLSDEDVINASLHLLFTPEFMESNAKFMEEVLEEILIAPMEPRCFMAQLSGITKWSIHPRLCDLNKPTLVIAGGRDILIPPENSRVLAEAIPDSRLVEIPESGHAATTMYPEEVAREVLDFLSENLT